MNCCNCTLRVNDIELRRGVYTLTVADGTLTGLCDCQKINLGIYTSVPLDSSCNTVEVTDGTTTLPIYSIKKCNNNINCVVDAWRTTLQCRSVICTVYSAGGENLTLNGLKGKMGCSS